MFFFRSDNIDYISDPDDTDELNETALFSQNPSKSQAENKSQKLMTKIITEVILGWIFKQYTNIWLLILYSQSNGVLCSFEQALVQLIYFEKKKQRSMPWNADLQIGSELKIKVSAYINVNNYHSRLKTIIYKAFLLLPRSKIAVLWHGKPELLTISLFSYQRNISWTIK